MGLATGVSVFGLLLFGTITSLFAKIVYELQGQGSAGQEKYFQKPWAMVLLMFIGMTFCLPIAYFQEWQAKRRRRKEEEAIGLLGGGPEDEVPKAATSWKQTLMLAIPTVFDLAATVLMNVGLLSVTASVYQMMRGAEMLFAALFSVMFLGRRLNKYHYGGILCCAAGITMVGFSSVLSGEGSSTHAVSTGQMLLGMALIVGSQCVQAVQVTFEDYFMSDMAIPPLKIVGYEGLFGSAMMLLVLLPIVQLVPGTDGQGIHEDSRDTLHMIFHSRTIAAVLLVDMLALLMYNFAGMCVTGHLGAVFRCVLETMRTLFVWLVDLLLFYTPLGLGTLGESWNAFSYLQAAGFAVLVSGTLVYSRGDEHAARKSMAELEGEGGASTATLARPGPAGIPVPGQDGGGVGAAPFGSYTRPIAMSATPSSFKSTMNISSFSSYTHRSQLAHTQLGTTPPPLNP